MVQRHGAASHLRFGMPWTPYADLDALIEELLGHVAGILGDGLAGAWIQGSFALVPATPTATATGSWRLMPAQGPVAALRGFTMKSRRARVTGRTTSRFVRPVRRARVVDTSAARWLFNDHGHRTLEWSDHCNRAYTRWILREHGITLIGPEPRTFIRRCHRSPAPPRDGDRDPDADGRPGTWLDIDAIAWGRATRSPACRLLYTPDRRGGQQGRGAGVGDAHSRPTLAAAAGPGT